MFVSHSAIDVKLLSQRSNAQCVAKVRKLSGRVYR